MCDRELRRAWRSAYLAQLLGELRARGMATGGDDDADLVAVAVAAAAGVGRGAVGG